MTRENKAADGKAVCDNPRNEWGERLKRLNDIHLNWEYWDCECDEDYIRSIAEDACARCGALQVEWPSSREDEVAQFRALRPDNAVWRKSGRAHGHFKNVKRETTQSRFPNLERYATSLVNAQGRTGRGFGLNWAFREMGRSRANLNEAYIPIREGVVETNFFPPLGWHFAILADDNVAFIFSRDQEASGKAINSPFRNSDIGLYFRKRLGLAPSAFIDVSDLHRYGRTTVDFYKLDEETYRMDFAPPG